jgi:thiol:disulfide interchange protein DsbA
MEMKRRNLALGMALTPLLAGNTWAAAEPIEGKDYTRLSSPIPVSVSGKVEVIEFFGYWCPHCSELEPKLGPWVRRLPADVNFRRAPVAWQEAHVPLQKLYYALESLGVGTDVHAKVFRAIHVQHIRLDSEAGPAAFAAENGLDKVRLADAMNGFSVPPKIRAANQLFASYRIDGVPTLTINGRYVTSPEQTGGEDRALLVADALIRTARSAR